MWCILYVTYAGLNIKQKQWYRCNVFDDSAKVLRPSCRFTCRPNSKTGGFVKVFRFLVHLYILASGGRRKYVCCFHFRRLRLSNVVPSVQYNETLSVLSYDDFLIWSMIIKKKHLKICNSPTTFILLACTGETYWFYTPVFGNYCSC